MAAQSAGKNNNSSSNEGSSSNHSAQLNKLNNWSMHNDSNNKLANYTQQQQQPGKEATKSSYELYQEAADLLGLSCSLCDNCRCVDCQVRICLVFVANGKGKL